MEECQSLLGYVSWLYPFDTPLALVTYDSHQAERVTGDLYRIGYERVRGYMPFHEWLEQGHDSDSFDALELAGAAALMARGDAEGLDVRFEREHIESPLAGALASDRQDPRVGSGHRRRAVAGSLRQRGARDRSSYLETHGVRAVPPSGRRRRTGRALDRRLMRHHGMEGGGEVIRTARRACRTRTNCHSRTSTAGCSPESHRRCTCSRRAAFLVTAPADEHWHVPLAVVPPGAQYHQPVLDPTSTGITSHPQSCSRLHSIGDYAGARESRRATAGIVNRAVSPLPPQHREQHEAPS
jgi:hypothetical protein